jgi:membrane protein YdbS with pleckstrin-like domain
MVDTPRPGDAGDFGDDEGEFPSSAETPGTRASRDDRTTDRIPKGRPWSSPPEDDTTGFDDIPAFTTTETDEIDSLYGGYGGGGGGGGGGGSGLSGGGGDRGLEPILDKEPSDLVRRYLFPTEKFRGEWRRHPIHIVKALSVGVLSTFVLGLASGFISKYDIPGATTVLVVIWVLAMGWVLWNVIEWYFDRFVLTNKRIMLVTGIVTRNVAMMPLARVTDMKYTQTPLGRVLGYGTFEIESAGQDQALRQVSDLPNPTDLYLQVVEEMYEPEASEARRKSSGGINMDDDGGI